MLQCVCAVQGRGASGFYGICRNVTVFWFSLLRLRGYSGPHAISRATSTTSLPQETSPKQEAVVVFQAIDGSVHLRLF